MCCEIEANDVFSISDAGIYISRLVNDQKISVTLDRSVTVNVLREELWKKCGVNSSLVPVAAILTTADGN